MNPNRKLFRLLHRISVLVAADQILWADLGELIREFGVKVEETGSTTTESKDKAENPSSTILEPDVEDNDQCSTAIAPEQVAIDAEPAIAPEPTRPKPPTAEHRICGIHELVANCQMKRDGCRWVLERMRLKEMGANHIAEIAPGDRAILEKARQLPDCHPWMNRPTAPIPDDLSHYATLSGCFEALAAVLTISANSQEILADDTALLETLLRLGAEAQSAVREAIRRVGGPTDQDQVAAFWWTRNTAAENGIYIERYLREEDRANPTSWNQLLLRISEFADQVEEQAKAKRRCRRLFGKLQYQLGQALSGDADHYWQSVASTVDELVQDGLPPSNVEVRDLLLPHIDIIPAFDNPPQSFQLVLREIRRFQESMVEETVDEDTDETSPQVEAAADMIRGRVVVLIGGDARSGPKDALEQAFHLSELIWIPTKHGQPVSTFEQFVARPEVAVVALAIRWASHAFTDVRHLCRKYGKPLVRLPGGYSPNQVAMQIMNQSSWRLKHSRQRAS